MSSSSPLEDLINMVEGLELSTEQYTAVSSLRTRLLNALVTLGLASGGGSGGLTLVENKTQTIASGSMTFSGLNGDVDKKYLMIGNVNSTTNPSNLFLKPNGLTTNLLRAGLRINSGGTGNLNAATWQLNGDTLADNNQSCFALNIFAAKIIEGQALRRYFTGTSTSLSSGTYEALIISGQWAETATNLTSLVLEKDIGNITAGSNVILYKYT